MLRTRAATVATTAVTTAALALLVAVSLPTASTPLVLAAASPRTTFATVTTDAQWNAGHREGTRASAGSLLLEHGQGRRTIGGSAYDWARWTGGWVSPGSAFTELIPSWNAATPSGTWVEVQARVRTSAGRVSTFKVLGRWSWRDDGFARTSLGSQDGGVARVATDTLQTDATTGATAYQLRVLLNRRTGTSRTPTLKSLQAVVSRRPAAISSTTRALPARILDVPRFSQMIHSGQYPAYGGGGEAWCSPTSLAMLLAYHQALPSAAASAWVSRSYADPWVDEVARRTYDTGYAGTGNWPFNTAYAATRTATAFVTRLDSLRQAEQFIAAGIPLEASIAFGRGQLTGAPISSTPGHLVVIIGFTRAGKVVVNDPAAPSNATVRRIYDRAQFERAWLTKSDGTVYVVTDAAHPLPPRQGARNW